MDNIEKQNDGMTDIGENTREEMRGIERSIDRDRKRFDELSKDKDVKNWSMKIFEKCCNEAMKKDFEKMKNVNVKEIMDSLMSWHKDLVIYITWDLKLPLSTEKFADLTTAQKLNFLALYETLNIWKDRSILWRLRDWQYSKWTDSKDIVNNCNQRLEWYYKNINDSFKRTNNLNLWNIKKTLEKDFWLTEKEAEKYKEYVLLIKNHPEYIWIIKPQEAGVSPWYFVVFGIWLVLWALWMYAIDHFWKWDWHTEIQKSRVEISDPESVLKLVTQEAEFSGRDTAERSLFQVQDDDSLLEELWKRVINNFENKQVTMEVKGKLAYQYDAWKYLKMEIDKDTWIVYIDICPPEVVVVDSHATIINKKNELIHLSDFDQVEMELFESIKEDAVNKAKSDPEFLSKCRTQTYEMLFPLFQSLKPYGVDIKGLQIRYVDEQWNELRQWPVDHRNTVHVNIN